VGDMFRFLVCCCETCAGLKSRAITGLGTSDEADDNRTNCPVSTHGMTSAELIETLERLGLPQQKLAELTGHNVRTVRRWMKDENVPTWLTSWLDMYERLHPTGDEARCD